MKHDKIIEAITNMITQNRTLRQCGYNGIVNASLSQNNDILARARTIIKKSEGEYERGLEDAWELANKLYNMNSIERENILGVTSDGYTPSYLSVVFRCFTPQQVIEKIAEYEKKKAEEEERKRLEESKPKVGDVVKYDAVGGPRKGIILSVYKGGMNPSVRTYYILDKINKSPQFIRDDSFTIKKTGDYVDITGFLDKYC